MRVSESIMGLLTACFVAAFLLIILKIELGINLNAWWIFSPFIVFGFAFIGAILLVLVDESKKKK